MNVSSRIVDALPASGPYPYQFTYGSKRTHTEGVAVEFTDERGDSWVGNFQYGATEFSLACAHPNSRHIVVVSRGQGYVIDPADRKLILTFGGTIDAALQDEDLKLLVLSEGVWITVVRSTDDISQTRRISWDGIRSLRIDGKLLVGEGFDVIDKLWKPFRVNLLTLVVEGGAYDEKMFKRVP